MPIEGDGVGFGGDDGQTDLRSSDGGATLLYF